MINQMRDTLAIVQGLLMGVMEYFSVKFVPSLLIPGFGFLFGVGSEKIMLALLVLVAMDFITGVASAKKAGVPIQSRRAVKSAYKVAIYGLLVSAGHLTEGIVPLTTYIEEAVTTFLALTELISIIENAGKMGFAVPAKLLNQLQEWRDGEPAHDRREGDATRRTDEIVIPKV